MADARPILSAALSLIDHEHKHERGSLELQISHYRDGVEWLCMTCGAEGFVQGVAICAARAREVRHA
jgi:hypothetical protein